MRYRLIVLTHDGDKTTPMLLDTLGSFEEMVTPKPTHRVLIEDGPRKEGIEEWHGSRIWGNVPGGFCQACELGWMEAAHPGVDYVFWLEHDFLFRRPVDLRELALGLSQNPLVSQMSLMRQAVNEREIRAGGVVGSLGGEGGFAPRFVQGDRRSMFLEQGIYWTTNPSLFPRKLAVEQPWPSGPNCEGKLTIQLRQEGYSFGVWGSGEPWVSHVGERTGHGY